MGSTKINIQLPYLLTLKRHNSVCRDGLMLKLKEMGITGKIWTWIKDFFTGRTATTNMNGFKGKKFSSYL